MSSLFTKSGIKSFYNRFVLIGTLTLAQACSATVDENLAGKDFTPLSPKAEHAITANQTLRQLFGRHYKKLRLNDDLSSQMFDKYIDALDGNKNYFLESDLKDFEKYRFKIDDALMRGDLTLAFNIYNRFQQRTVERISFLLTQLPDEAKKYRFDINESFELDREEAAWAKTKEELDILWKRRLKNSILASKISDDAEKESAKKKGKKDSKENKKKKDKKTDIYTRLNKRYTNHLNRIHQTNSDDAFQQFMNAVTETFDPHTQYFSPRNTENFNINMSLSLQGIGAVLQIEDEFTKVVRLVPAGPAEKAGELKTSDKIIAVGQSREEMEDVIGWRLDEVVNLIRGEKGTTVYLEIIDDDSNEHKVISIVRDEVKLEEQSAQKEVVEIKRNGKTHKVGVINIPTFYIDFQALQMGDPDYKSTSRDVEKLLVELKKENVEGLIIDLRNNGGGSLKEALDLTDLFIPEGPVVQVRYSNGYVKVEPGDDMQDPGVFFDKPLAVLTNRLSASASEIFAGAIQDYGRGIVVGGQTFGKGTVQQLIPLERGQVKLTQAKFYRISGESTQLEGVMPDILFPSLFDKEKIGESSYDKALAWDTIRPAGYQSSNQVQALVPKLNQLHKSRIKDNPDFDFISAQKDLIKDFRDKTDVSLNEKTRLKDKADKDAKFLAIENERRKEKGLKILKDISELDAEKEEKELAKEKNKDKSLNSEDDALLIESGNILLDMIDLSSQQGSHQVAKQNKAA